MFCLSYWLGHISFKSNELYCNVLQKQENVAVRSILLFCIKENICVSVTSVCVVLSICPLSVAHIHISFLYRRTELCAVCEI